MEPSNELELTDESVVRKLNLIAQKLIEIHEIYPRPIPYTKIRAPVQDGTTLYIEFDRPIRMPIYLIPPSYLLPIFMVNRDNVIRSVEVKFHDGQISHVVLINDSRDKPFIDYNAALTLSQLVMPSMLRILKTAKATSESDEAVQWFGEFIDTVEFAYGLSEVDSIDVRDLLSNESRLNGIVVIMFRPTKNVDTMSVTLRTEESLLTVELIALVDEIQSIDGAFTCELDGSEVRRITLSVSADRRSLSKPPEIYIKHILNSVPDSLFDGIVKFTKKFLRAYKVLRVASSFMNL